MAQFVDLPKRNSLFRRAESGPHARRFSGFKFVLGEAGVCWLPYGLDRMDEEYEDRYSPLGLSMKPSELWRRQGYSAYQHEPSVAKMIPLIGEDNIMLGSDHPHPDGIWADLHTWIAGDIGSVTPALRRKLLCDNAGKLSGKLYGLF
jgi:predicted TIM-barrel fold metal-dependent hydrolase